MTYYVHLSQNGGCDGDYPIACGERLDKLKATTHDEAVAEAESFLAHGGPEDLPDYYGRDLAGAYGDEHNISKATVLEVKGETTIDTKSLYEKFRRLKNERAKANEDAAELELLAKLKAKYEKAQ